MSSFRGSGECIAEHLVSCDLEVYVRQCWEDRRFYESFLRDKLLDLNVEVQEWRDEQALQSAISTVSRVRKISSRHPSKVSFPGLASHAESHKFQRYDVSVNTDHATLVEENNLKGIPFADYFSVRSVIDVWCTLEGPAYSPVCKVKVYMIIDFHQSTWLKSQILSNTRAELKDIYREWFSFCDEKLARHFAEKAIADVGLSAPGEDVEDEVMFFDCEDPPPLIETQPLRKLSRASSFYNSPRELNPPSPTSLGSMESTDAHVLAVTIVEILFVFVASMFWSIHEFNAGELKEYFDISSSEVLYRALRSFLPGSHKHLLKKPDLYGPLLAVFTLPQVLLFAMDISRHHCRRDMLLGNSVMVSLGLWFGLSLLYKLIGYLVGSPLRLRDILCTCGYSFYGWSIAILTSFALEASTGITGKPSMISLLIFGIPSAISVGFLFWDQTPASRHRPGHRNSPRSVDQHKTEQQFPHLDTNLNSIRKRSLRDDDFELQSLLPTPMESTTLQSVDQTISAHSPLHSRSRTCIGACSSCCSCSQCISFFKQSHRFCMLLLKKVVAKILWLVPKAIGFVIVCGTHYQFLWYLARVFLPGKKELCKITSLLQPQDYANIITQKDLRNYLSGIIDHHY